MNAGFRWALALLFATCAIACAEQLATLPPSDHYLASEPGEPKLDGDQKDLVTDVNAELAKFGIPAATPGAYEMDVAAMIANIQLSKMWHGSSHKISDESMTPGAKQGGAFLDGGVYAPLYPVSDEPASNDPATIHWEQQLWARGVPLNFKFDVEAVPFPRSGLHGDEIEKAVNSIRPAVLYGKLKIGVARLAERGDNQVIFVVVLRDERVLLTKTPARQPAPGSEIELAGQIVDKSLAKMRLGLLTPDGTVQMQEVVAKEDGTFSASVQMPAQMGLYLLTLAGRGYGYALFNVPLFVGVAPTPWPPTADPAAPPIDGPRALAKQLAGDVNAWRVAHKLPRINVDAKLSAIAKAEATRTGENLAKARGDKPITEAVAQSIEQMSPQAEAELKAAGFDLALVRHYFDFRFDDKVPDWLAQIPWDAIAANAMGSTAAEHMGVGVVMAPKNSKDDSSSALYVIDWFMVVRPPPPEPPAPEVPPVAADAGVAPIEPAAPAASPPGTGAPSGTKPQ